jgi:hypothetical protein
MNWHEYFTYDQETGLLAHRLPPRSRFKTDAGWRQSVTKLSRNTPGSIHYINGKPHAIFVVANRQSLYAHRIIWEMCNGPIPKGMEIDHIDCDPCNNRLHNLRLASRAENCRNTRVKRSGLKGAWFDARSKKWGAEIRAGEIRKWLGSFDTQEEAHAAYCAAAKELHGEFARFK